MPEEWVDIENWDKTDSQGNEFQINKSQNSETSEIIFEAVIIDREGEVIDTEDFLETYDQAVEALKHMARKVGLWFVPTLEQRF